MGEKHEFLHMFRGTWPQILAVTTGTISAVSDGMQYGWSAPMIPILKSPSSPMKITDKDVELIETIFLIGALMGLPVTNCLVDRIGRKKTILLACITNLIGWTLIAFGPSPVYLHVARFLTGLASDVNFVAAPMYVAEIADPKIRGFLAGIIYLMILLGILVIYSVAPFVSIFASCSVGIALLILELLTFPFMPESPYFLISKNDCAAARKSLVRLRGDHLDIDDELENMVKGVERQKVEERGRPLDLFLIPSNRKAVIIMTVLNGAQHFSSVSVILMNLHEILGAAGSAYLDSNIAAIIFSGIMLISAASSSFYIDKYGRRILLILSSFFTSLCLIVVAMYFALQRLGYNLSAVSWIPMVAIMVYAAAFKFGLGMVPIVLTAELFNVKVKAMGMTLSSFMYIFFGLLSIQIYQFLAGPFGIHVPFFIFAGACILTTIFSVFYVPETKGKSLEEIQVLLKGTSQGYTRFEEEKPETGHKCM